MADRTITADLIGKDKMSHAFDSAGKSSDRLGGKLTSLGGKGLAVGKTLGKAGAMVGGLTSALGPASIMLAKTAVGAAHLGAAMAPAVALLPALVGGFALLKGTMLLVGPAMGRAMKPISDLFGDEKNPGPLRKRIEELAARGLPELAQAFVKVNMPSIASGMERIAVSSNRSATTFGRWVNSAAGVKVIRDVTDGMARAFERAAPSITGAAISLLNMTGRANVSDRLAKLGDVVGGLADKFNRWTDSVTSGDIDGALSKAKSAAGAFADKLRMVKDVIVWIADHPDAIKKMSDGLAGVGIALGLATGGWVGVVAGAVTLIANHWDTLKPKFASAAEWAKKAWKDIREDPNVRGIVAALKEIGGIIRDDFAAAWAAIKPKLDDFGDSAKKAWAAVGPLIVGMLKNKDVQNGLRIIAMGIAAVATAMVVLSGATATTAAVAVGALTGLIAWMVGKFIPVIAGVVSTALSLFGHFASGLGGIISHVPGMEGVGKALRSAGDTAQAAAGKVRGLAEDIAGVRSKTVYITAYTSNIVRSKGGGGSTAPGAGLGRSASGGPMQAGRPYLVGERGPEVVTSSRSGYVWPNGTGPATRGGGGQSGGGLHVHLHAGTVIGTSRELAQQVISALTSPGSGISRDALRAALGVG